MKDYIDYYMADKRRTQTLETLFMYAKVVPATVLFLAATILLCALFGE